MRVAIKLNGKWAEFDGIIWTGDAALVEICTDAQASLDPAYYPVRQVDIPKCVAEVLGAEVIVSGELPEFDAGAVY
jgi:hypothetical protein